MSFLYNCVLLLSLPWILYKRFVRGKFRGNFLQRFGCGFPHIEKGKRPLIWMHAVSLGETKAMTALAKQIKKKLEDPLIIISSITETGHREAKNAIPFADAHVYLPFDLSWIIRPIVKRIRPDMVVLCETDLWYHFLKSAKEVGAKIALVNGKLSKNSLKNYQRLLPITGKLFQLMDLYCLQSETYLERFKQLGVPETKMVITGNLKFDREFLSLNHEQKENWRKKLGVKPGAQVLVIGSTHDPEEKIILESLREVWAAFPHLKVLLAPRTPERFGEVEKFLTENQVPMSRYSKSANSENLVLIDEMGLLDFCYQIADLAIVGGSFTDKVGGHNILEPCAFGTAVLFGPYMHSQPDLEAIVKKFKAGKQIDAESITSEISYLLRNPEERKSLGFAGLSLMATVKGAADRTFDSISLSLSL